MVRQAHHEQIAKRSLRHYTREPLKQFSAIHVFLLGFLASGISNFSIHHLRSLKKPILAIYARFVSFITTIKMVRRKSRSFILSFRIQQGVHRGPPLRNQNLRNFGVIWEIALLQFLIDFFAMADLDDINDPICIIHSI